MFLSNKISLVPFRNALLDWYATHKRDLPWRKTKDPYKIWLSEVMLQQTTVKTVIPYYLRFLKKFPNIQSVAHAREADLLHAWAGLGYYTRIRQFQKACQIIVRDYNGSLPSSADQLTKLPGFGPYTSAAVASIAFCEPVAVVDGNVKRVISRLFAYSREISSSEAAHFFGAKARDLLDPQRPGDFNQAIMELGAVVCTPRNPSCTACPVRHLCRAHAAGLQEKFPVRSKKIIYHNEQWACPIFMKKGKFFLKKRKDTEILSGMWEFPHRLILKGQHISSSRPIRHAIMNRRITVHPFFATLSEDQKMPPAGKWFALNELSGIPLTTVTRKIVNALILGCSDSISVQGAVSSISRAAM